MTIVHYHVQFSSVVAFWITVFIIISAIGRGLKSGDNFELLYKLAEKLNAAGKSEWILRAGIVSTCRCKSIQCVGGHVGSSLVWDWDFSCPILNNYHNLIVIIILSYKNNFIWTGKKASQSVKSVTSNNNLRI